MFLKVEVLEHTDALGRKAHRLSHRRQLRLAGRARLPAVVSAAMSTHAPCGEVRPLLRLGVAIVGAGTGFVHGHKPQNEGLEDRPLYPPPCRCKLASTSVKEEGALRSDVVGWAEEG